MPTRTSYENGVPNWVDLASTDPEAAKAFYGGLFGWAFDERPTDQDQPYIMATIDGRPVAGMMQMPPDMQASGVPSMWTTYVAVDDIDATLEKVAGTGGQVMMPPMQVMEAGRMALIVDPTGGVVGLWQAQEHVGAGVVNEHGAVTWNELQTPDPAAAAAFYDSVFGWKRETMEMGDQGEYTVFALVGGEGIAGATKPPMPEVPTHWSTVFATEDADATAGRAGELGGTVYVEPFDVPVGRLTIIADPTGAVFQAIAINQPEPD